MMALQSAHGILKAKPSRAIHRLQHMQAQPKGTRKRARKYAGCNGGGGAGNAMRGAVETLPPPTAASPCA